MFLKMTSFHGIQLDTLFVSPDSSRKKELANLVNEGIRSGAVVPLCTSIFPEEQVEQAFRYFHTLQVQKPLQFCHEEKFIILTVNESNEVFSFFLYSPLVADLSVEPNGQYREPNSYNMA